MDSHLALSTLNLGLGGLVFLLGLVILRENPHQRVNRLVAMMLFFGGFGAVLAGLSFLGSGPRTSAQQAPDLLTNMAYVWEFFFPTLFAFASVFPEERGFTDVPNLRIAGRRIWTPSFNTLVFAPYVFHFLLMVAITLWKPSITLPQSGPLHLLAPILQVVGVFGGLFLVFHQALFSLVNLGFGLASIALLFNSLRRARVPRLRRQLGAIAVGMSASMACYSLAALLPTLFNFHVPDLWRSAFTIVALTLGPGSIAYSVVRFKFLDTKLLARRGILYALASGVLVGFYLLIVNQVNHYLTSITGSQAKVLEPVLLILALALFQPAIARLEEMLDQVFLRDPSDYRNVLRHLGRELQTTIDLEVLLARTVDTVAETLILEHAHIVALSQRGMVAHTGAGAPLSPEARTMLARVLPKVSTRQTSYRLTDRIEGVSREEQDEMVAGLELSLLVPLQWRGDLVGALLLGDKVLGTDYTAEDVNLLTALAGQVSVSLQNALLLRDRVEVARFEEELNLARQIQRRSLLSEFPPMPRSEVHAIYIPSKHVGGDFYDVVPTGDGGFLVAIADVSGKGVPAALLSSMLQASLRTQAASVPSVAAILRNTNALLYRSTALHQFATFFLARIDGESLQMTFCNAGHNWPVVMRPGGGREFLERGGTILGILEQLELEEASVQLAPGEIVVLYTDGISEAADPTGEQYGEQRLCECVAAQPPGLPARDIAERVLIDLRAFLAGTEAQDDITLLVLRVMEPVAATDGAAPRIEVAVGSI